MICGLLWPSISFSSIRACCEENNWGKNTGNHTECLNEVFATYFEEDAFLEEGAGQGDTCCNCLCNDTPRSAQKAIRYQTIDITMPPLAVGVQVLCLFSTPAHENEDRLSGKLLQEEELKRPSSMDAGHRHIQMTI